jgi:hypothetical protein
MRRFVKDDQGYVDWLASHPGGYVLNTYAHVTSDYLILHRAACRTVNRPLDGDRSWTIAYGKSCSDDRQELEAWAIREVGKPVSPCGICMRESGSARPAKTYGHRDSVGPRAPRPTAPIRMDGSPVVIVISRSSSTVVDAPRLVIEGAQWLAETFFRRDPSAIGPSSYDAWIAATQRDPALLHRITDEDVTAVNRTMAARTGHGYWAPVIEKDSWSWLEAIDPAWDLFRTTDGDWRTADVAAKLNAAFSATRRAGLHLAVITKVLHIKRPNMFPVLDSVVIQQVGARVTDDISTWVDAMEQIRSVGRANLAPLQEVQTHLADRGISGRTLVRILDALLWVSSPGSGMFNQLSGWDRVIRPRSDDLPR